jgi:hypothetical protein
MHTLHKPDVLLRDAIRFEDPVQGVRVGGSKRGFKVELGNDRHHFVSLALFQLLHELEDLPTGAPTPACPLLRVVPHPILFEGSRHTTGDL